MIHGAISKTTRHTLHIITLYYDLVVNNNDIGTFVVRQAKTGNHVGYLFLLGQLTYFAWCAAT